MSATGPLAPAGVGLRQDPAARGRPLRRRRLPSGIRERLIVEAVLRPHFYRDRRSAEHLPRTEVRRSEPPAPRGTGMLPGRPYAQRFDAPVGHATWPAGAFVFGAGRDPRLLVPSSLGQEPDRFGLLRVVSEELLPLEQPSHHLVHGAEASRSEAARPGRNGSARSADGSTAMSSKSLPGLLRPLALRMQRPRPPLRGARVTDIKRAEWAGGASRGPPIIRRRTRAWSIWEVPVLEGERE